MTHSRRALTCLSLIYFIHFIHCYVVVVIDSADLRQSDIRPALSTNKVSVVKRIVPHDYKTPEFEYDRKYKTVFVPKYRVHQTRNEKKRNGLDFDAPLMHPVKLYNGQNPIVNAILNALGKQDGRYSLRNTEEMDGKEYDPINVQSNKPVTIQYEEGIEAKKKRDMSFNFPHFSPFNTWTYDKSLMQDRCPLNMAKLGRYCIYAPHIITK